jgi:hypothetical protein
MASNFTNFLVSLVDDPQKLDTLKQDPDAVMVNAGLTPSEKTLLLSGNMQLIRLAILNDPGHKEALGIPPDQNLPTRMPMLVHP